MRIKLKHIIFTIISLYSISVVGQVCEAKFTSDVNTEISPLTYNFNDISNTDGTIVNWEWNFGEGQSSSLQNPEHQYLSEGKYLVSLKITTDNSCTSTYTDTINVQLIPHSTCQAYFTVVKLTSSPDYTYKFTDHSIYTSDSIISWQWNFGDLSNSNIQHPIHQYVNPGNYNTSLSITTASGCSSSYNYQLSIYSGSAPCIASFSFNQDTLSGNQLKYHFHDNSYSNASITSWSWDFGDGDSSALQDPDHIFPFQGFYFIKLKIKNLNGCTDSMIYPIKVGNPQQYNLWGRVYAGNYVIDKCIAYLYKEYYNNIYIPVDTVRLTTINDTLGVYYFYQVLEGKHKVKVLLPNNSVFAEDFAPTYFGDNYNWSSAGTLNLLSDISMANVYLEDVVLSQGTNQINGKIISYDTEIKQEDVEILLFNSNGDIIAYTFSDSSGNFQFNDVQNGLLSVIGEITGYFFEESLISFNGLDTINNLVLKIENKKITGINSEEAINYQNSITLYPNPVNDLLRLDFNQQDFSELTISITDITGKTVLLKECKTGSDLNLNVSSLYKGVYLLCIYDSNNRMLASKKLVKL